MKNLFHKHANKMKMLYFLLNVINNSFIRLFKKMEGFYVIHLTKFKKLKKILLKLKKNITIF